MTQEAHTPEPWQVGPVNEEGIYTGMRPISDMAGHWDDFAQVHCTVDGKIDNEGEANARRIVACVNALAGIPIETIEALPEGELARLIQEMGK